jgi:Asp-tRNA(Asn)/Glu-tRNA(Gln) amidotransferase A subunit family amidase
VTPRLAIVGGPTWEQASEDVKGLFAELGEALGDRADAVSLPEVFDNAWPAQQRVMKTGFARNLRHYRERGEGEVSQVMREAMDEGAATTAVDYLSALDWQDVLRAGLGRIFDRYDAILTPSAPGEAPPGLASTGVASFNFLWTFVGAPCITLPVAKGSSGLPIGVQLVGRPGEDARLVSVARWLNERLSAA